MRSLTALLAFALAATTLPAQAPRTTDHYVGVRSTAPSMAGETAMIYVRERTTDRGVSANRAGVVLFIHGAGTPAEVAFDAAGKLSWMAYLANEGFDTFAVDMTGYGRSTRPPAMNTPCNLGAAAQAAFVPSVIPAPCTATSTGSATTIASDWNDIDAAVAYIRKLRNVERVSLIAWSLGGPRAGGYAAQHPEFIDRVVLLAPAYNRSAADSAPAGPGRGTPYGTQTKEAFFENWDRQVGCPNQFDPAARDLVWLDMLASDPVAARWGPGVRRAPNTASWGWNAKMLAKSNTPMLLIAGEHDRQVSPASVRALYDDLAGRPRVLIDLACSSHMAMWEKNHEIMFKASLEWLTKGTVNGAKEGAFKLGSPPG
jgi:pimeloyl-ACP methyl ester carboxylesterase